MLTPDLVKLRPALSFLPTFEKLSEGDIEGAVDKGLLTAIVPLLSGDDGAPSGLEGHVALGAEASIAVAHDRKRRLLESPRRH